MEGCFSNSEFQEENVDGTSVIVELKDDVYLTVNPPKGLPLNPSVPSQVQDSRVNFVKGSGKRVTIETIKQQLIDKRVTSLIDFEIVKQAIEMGTGYPIKISSVNGKKVEFKEGGQEGKRAVELGIRNAEVGRRTLNSELRTPKSEIRTSFKTKIARNIRRALGVGDVDVTISEDEIEAYITVYSLPKKNKVTYIIEKLMKKSVIYGVDEKKIFEVIRNNLFFKQILIAKGKAPKEGKNAELMFKIGINKEKGVKIEQRGNIDYYYLDSAPHVKKNEVLVEKKAPVPAEMGISVKGDKIKPCDLRGVARRNDEAKQSVPRNKPGGQDVPLPVGKNTVISEDAYYAEPSRTFAGSGQERLRLTGSKLLAAIDGYLTFSDGKFNIDRNCMVVKSDVDASIGKVYFQGNVFIAGNVFEGLTVEADGDIEIQGYVHKALLNSKDGNVIIRKGAYKSNIEANGDIRIGMADESRLFAKGNILIDGDLLNCSVTGEKKVFVDGEIVGGKVCAGMEITANNIGSPDHVPTTVQIVEKDSQLFLLEDKMRGAVEKLSSLGQKLTTNTSKELLIPIIEEYIALKRRVSQLKSEHLQLLKTKLKDSSEDSAPSLKANKTIRVYDMIYDGVEIQIGEAKLRIKEEEYGVVFFRDGNYLTYSPLSRPLGII